MYKDYMLKYMPLVYWKVNSNTTETSQIFGGTSRTLTKTSTTSSYIPNIYGDSTGSRCLVSGNSMTYSSSNLPLARTGYENKPFTVVFAYKTTYVASSSTAIFSIGSNINVYHQNGYILLNFRGQKFIYRINSEIDLYIISVHFDGVNPFLMVNGESSESYNSMTLSFESSPTFTWSHPGGSSSVTYITNIGIYGYSLTKYQLQNLFQVASQSSNYNQFCMHNNGELLSNLFIKKQLMKSFSPIYSQTQLRNVAFSGNTFSLNRKSEATINTGASYNGSTGYVFSNSGCIYFTLKPYDIPFNGVKFTVNSSNLYTATGTVFEILGSSTITVKNTASGTIQVYKDGTSVYSNSSMGSNTKVELNFIDNSMTLTLGSTESESFSTILSGISSVYVGNNSSYADSTLRDPYSGIMQDFTINYYTYPLSVGIYKLDLTRSTYSGTIKCIQDGVATFNSYFPSGQKTGNIKFDSTGITIVKGISLSSISNWNNYYNGSAGTSYTDGSSILTSSEDTLAFAVLLSDSNISSSSHEYTNSSVSNLMVESYSDSIVPSINSAMSLTSSTSNAFIMYNNLDSDVSRYNGIVFKTNSNVTLSNVNSSARTVAFTLQAGTVANPTGTILTLGSVTLTMTYVSATSYTLTPSSGTTMYVNETSVSGGSASATLLSNVKYHISLIVPSASYSSIVFSNLNGHKISQLVVFSTAFSSTQIAELAQKTHTPLISVQTDSNTKTLSDSVSGKAFSARIIYSM